MKKKVITATVTKPVQKTTGPGYSTQDLNKIKTRAYYIWESKGKPVNQDFHIWLEAEKALRREKLLK